HVAVDRDVKKGSEYSPARFSGRFFRFQGVFPKKNRKEQKSFDFSGIIKYNNDRAGKKSGSGAPRRHLPRIPAERPGLSAKKQKGESDRHEKSTVSDHGAAVRGIAACNILRREETGG
ncbi:MAG: hypothetical protein J5592_03185, partial [Clostridia bacterium]|nr:hypothetical protein [Clostridia bacterium]